MFQQELGDKLENVTDSVWTSIQEFLNIGFHFGEGENKVDLTIGTLLVVVVSFLLTHVVLQWIRKLTTRNRDEIDTLKFMTIFRFVRYVVFVLVFFIILSYTGINVTPFLAASAALLVGVGLALQELFQDVIGGVVLMLDKSIGIGDVVEVDGKVGKVIEINLRSTRALTRDDKVLIVPNHMFIRNSIFNYTQNHQATREKVRVGVAYGSDTRLVKELLLESVQGLPNVARFPTPMVLFEDFGDSALIFTVYYFVEDSFITPRTGSNIRFRIDELFREHDIKIPFPQRDVHLFQPPKLSD
ncbi:mechanosensitive ion channel family protein [Aureitalea marina]|uniref:Mechanosensitive ion channel protein MscS n=1 Tax=Aureitalea marina TaxID=930804 RepID=A0A2S7KMH4_9FLAO|nr:mechanosensitive ion channel domain-containing protein [Aureitalea marina]PQB03835.1 mechanosensitive ion channel protein MscS [Aureitalea marina]